MVDRTEAIIRKWLAHLSILSDKDNNDAMIAALYSYANDKDIITALYSYLDDINNEYLKDIKVNDLCRVLLEYYRSELTNPCEADKQTKADEQKASDGQSESDEQNEPGRQNEPELKCFTLQFLPQILYIYLNAIANSDKETIRSTEAFIIGIYNLEIIDDKGQPKEFSFRLPTLAQSSIFHECPAFSIESSSEKLKPKSSTDPAPSAKSTPKKSKSRSSIDSALSTKPTPKKSKPKSSTDPVPSTKSSPRELKPDSSTHTTQLVKSPPEELVLESLTDLIPSTESSPKKSKPENSQLVEYGPFQCVDKLTAQNRLLVLSRLLVSYKERISFISKFSMETLEKICKVSSKIAMQGFSESDSRRITVSSSFLRRLLDSLDFAMFNGFKYEALQAIDAIEFRAAYHGLNDVTLWAKAIKNYLNESQADGGLVDIGVPVASSITTATKTPLSKSMITNASFTTEKLPDDIPIQDPHHSENADEEKEKNSNAPEMNPRRSLPKIAANFSKKTREKIAIVVRSGSISSIKGVMKNNSILLSAGDASETDESGIEVGDSGSDVSSLASDARKRELSITLQQEEKIRKLINTSEWCKS